MAGLRRGRGKIHDVHGHRDGEGRIVIGDVEMIEIGETRVVVHRVAGRARLRGEQVDLALPGSRRARRGVLADEERYPGRIAAAHGAELEPVVHVQKRRRHRGPLHDQAELPVRVLFDRPGSPDALGAVARGRRGPAHQIDETDELAYHAVEGRDGRAGGAVVLGGIRAHDREIHLGFHVGLLGQRELEVEVVVGIVPAGAERERDDCYVWRHPSRIHRQPPR